MHNHYSSWRLITQRADLSRLLVSCFKPSQLVSRFGQVLLNGIQLVQDARLEQFNANFHDDLHALLRAGHGYQAEYAQLRDTMVNRERAYRNTASGFSTFTGLPPGSRQALHGHIPVPPSVQIVLASAGAARAWTHFDHTMEAGFTHALGQLAADIRTCEQADLNGQQHPRVVSSDGISFIWLTRC